MLAEAAAAFHRAGGAEFLRLIGNYPHLLLHYPADAALALLETLPLANVALGIATALIALLIGMQTLTTHPADRSWPSAGGQP